NTRGLDRLRSAFQAQGYQLVIDDLAQARSKNRNWKTDFVVYVEDVTPEELAQVLEKVGLDDHKGETKQRAAGPFSQVILLPLTQADHRELSKLLGVDPTKLDPPRKGPIGIDIRKPLAKTTAEELHRSLAGQGTPRPEAGK